MDEEQEHLLSAYVDGELDAGGVAEVEALLATDAQARRMVEMYRETGGMLRAAMAEAISITRTARSGCYGWLKPARSARGRR